MAPTILIIGATGNTGRSVASTLPGLIKASKTLSNHHIIALTRSKDSPAAKAISASGIEVLEQNWIEITSSWLKSHNVERLFIASHNEPTQFAEESQLHNEALRAGVKYVVRISTTHANVTPDSIAYYPRAHWAIEQMLSSPEFKAMQWSSLQPNVFLRQVLPPAVDFIKTFRKTGHQPAGGLALFLDETAPVGVISADDVGTFAAHLLASDDTSPHAGKKYVLNGPENINGRRIVDLVEGHIGEKVKEVKFRDVEFIHQWADSVERGSKNLIRSIADAPTTSWEGQARAETTSKEVWELAAPVGTVEGVLGEMLEE